MSRQQDEQAIALAGLFQAAALVEQIATRGMVSQSNIESSLYSIMQLDPESTEAIYGEPKEVGFNLQLGFQHLTDLVNKPRTQHNKDIIRYALSMMHLERKLASNGDMLQTLGQRIKQISEQARYFNGDNEDTLHAPSSYCHPNVIANIASLYQDTISTFSFRIQVTGDPRHLQNSENAAKIRALLLAGIRSAMLWRQNGGKRWHLLFVKSRVRPSLKKILG